MQCCGSYGSEFRIGFNADKDSAFFMSNRKRIRIHYFMLMQIRIQGFDDKFFLKFYIKKINIFLIKSLFFPSSSWTMSKIQKKSPALPVALKW